MQILTAGNLIASVLQVGVLAAAMALALVVLRVRNPRVRFMTWRVLLAFGVVMPFVQPWTVTTTIVAGTHTLMPGSVDPVAAAPIALNGYAQWLAPRALPVALLTGCTLRLLWLAAGLLRLRKQRRTHGTEGDGAAAIQAELGTRATIHFVDGLRQPATCGWIRPAVLLPARLRSEPPAVVRAVLVHELLHVKRHDWAALVVEEVLRALHWFNPALWWLIDRVQLSREEVVDADAIPLAGGRRVYVRALLAFADARSGAPVPAFARRRHLFTRITRLSQESNMSPRRVVLTVLTLLACAAAAGMAAVEAFPLSGGHELLVARTPDPPAAPAVQDPKPPPPPPPVPVEARTKAGPKKPPPPPPTPVEASRTTTTAAFVLVTGEVKKPGQLAFTEGRTVEEIVSLVGGATAIGAPDRATITRTHANGKRVTFGAHPSDVLQRGDVLFVPRKPN